MQINLGRVNAGNAIELVPWHRDYVEDWSWKGKQFLVVGEFDKERSQRMGARWHGHTFKC